MQCALVSNRLNPGVAALIVAALAGMTLGCTTVKTREQYMGGPLPKPDRILVYTFAYSPSQVRLDRGITPEIERSIRGGSRTAAELETGAKLAGLVTDRLVKEIRDMGLPAQRAFGDPVPWGNTYSIEGQFLSIDEGNRTERVIIGLGAGRTDVQIATQLYQDSAGGQQVLETLDVSAKSGRKPGMAETMAAGGALGTLAVSAAVSTATAVGSEKFGANVEADASRGAKAVAKKLREFFAQQGWVSPS